MIVTATATTMAMYYASNALRTIGRMCRRHHNTMTGPRKSIIQTQLMDMIPFAIQSITPEQNHTLYPDHTRVIQRRIDITNMLKILHSCQTPIQYTKLYKDSGFQYKEGFNLYLHFLSRFDMISKHIIKRNHCVIYGMTPKGRQFYNMFVLEERAEGKMRPEGAL